MQPMLETTQLVVTDSVVQAYAQLTDDFNPIHLDPTFAAGTPLGRPIAHGTLSLCLIWQSLQKSFGDGVFEDVELEVKFVKPVFIGDVITAGGHVDENEPCHFAVWVRGGDGSDRITGSVRLAERPGSQGEKG